MRLPKRGEKGFTLIELLIVVAILGVLAAVVIPNIGRFIGAGEEEAKDTELSNVQAAVHAMMVDNELALLPATFIDDGSETRDMGAFPDATVTLATKGADGPFVTAAIAALDITAERTGWLLFGNQIVVDVDGDGAYDAVDGDAILEVNYVANTQTAYWYWVDASGTVAQEDAAP